MRAVGYAPALAMLLALAAAACAAPAQLAVPPVVDIPALPEPRPVRASTPAPPGDATAAPPLAMPAPWTERIERSEKTKSVARCQISPFSFASVMVVENRILDGGRLGVRVVQDDENAKGVQALPALLGKGYVVEKIGHSLHVHSSGGEAVPDDEALRVRALATAVLGWPGGDVASHLPAVGAEVDVLELPVVAIAAIPLHGDLSAQESKALVRYAGIKKGDVGDELAFDVEVKVSEGDAGMCHRWLNEAVAKGELRIRAQGGSLLGLHLQGQTHDTEGVCQGPSGGPPPAPHTCNRGEVTIEIRQPHVP